MIQENKAKELKTGKQSTAEILAEIIKVLGQGEEIYSRIGTVNSVDSDEKTVNVTLLDGATIEDVRLQQVASDSGLFITPTVDSLIILGFTDKTTAYVALCSQIDSIVFQGGENGGLIKIADLVTSLNNIENDINSLKSAFSTWTIVANDGGAALKTATATWYDSSLTVTQQSDLENENFKH